MVPRRNTASTTNGATRALEMDTSPGTYALLLAVHAPVELQIGALGIIKFESPFCMYFGSALGPGGVKARIKHHLQPVHRTHWHVDYLRQEADVQAVWYCNDPARLECVWANAALQHRGVSPVPQFGSSDCGCYSHLLKANKLPSLRSFRRQVRGAASQSSAPIRELLLGPGG